MGCSHGLDSLRGRLEARGGHRKVCGVNRTRKGADTQQVLSIVVRTACQRDLDLPTLTAEMLRAPEPAIPEVSDSRRRPRSPKTAALSPSETRTIPCGSAPPRATRRFADLVRRVPDGARSAQPPP